MDNTKLASEAASPTQRAGATLMPTPAPTDDNPVASSRALALVV